MKIKKILKTTMISVGVLTPIAATSVAVVSCGKKQAPAAKPTFDTFADKAKKESASNIIKNANPAAKGWDSVSDAKVVSATPVALNGTVIVVISSVALKQSAVFTATYVKDTAYDVSKDWACSQQPAATVTFDTFKKNAESGGPTDVFTGIKAANPSGIGVSLDFAKVLKLNTDSSQFIDSDPTKVVFKLVLSGVAGTGDYARNTTINLTIPFNGVAYDVKNWTSSQYVVADFKKDLTTSVNTAAWKTWALSQGSWNSSQAWKAINKVAITQTENKFDVALTNNALHQTEHVSITFKTENNKAKLYSAMDWSTWTFDKAPTTDNWAQFKDNVTKWAKADPNAKVTIKDAITQIVNNGMIDPAKSLWAKSLNDSNPNWAVKPTSGKSTDETNHIMYYTITVNDDDNKTAADYTVDIKVQYNSSPDLKLTDFIWVKTNHHAFDWASVAEKLLTSVNTNNDNSQTLIATVYQGVVPIDHSPFPNLKKFLLGISATGDDLAKIKVFIDVNSFKYIPKDDTGNNDNGEVSYKMVFYNTSDTTNKNPLTSGGEFAITKVNSDSNSADLHYINTITDTNK